MRKRVLSLLLAVTLCFSMQPMTASAQGTDAVTVQEVQNSKSETDADAADAVAVQDVSGGNTTGAKADDAGASDDGSSNVNAGGAETIGTDVSGNMALLTARVQTGEHRHPVCGET